MKKNIKTSWDPTCIFLSIYLSHKGTPMTSPRYGIAIIQQNTDPRPSSPSDLSIIGLVLPSDDAVAASFPLDTPVAFDSSDATYLTALGTGDLYKVANTIDNQLADLQTSARIVAVRVASGNTPQDTMANIIGNRAQGTGLYALLNAGTLLGVVPRLIGAPGYTGLCNCAVQAVNITDGGSNYTQANGTFSPLGATGTAAITKGVVSSITLTAPGNYPPGTNVTATITGDGTGATANV